MSIPRRKFIKAGIVAAACAGLPLTIGPASAQKQDGSRPQGDYFQIPSEVQNDPMSYYNMATFTPYVKTGFLILIGKTWRYMTLVEVKNLNPLMSGNEPVKNLNESFSLIFLASRGQKIEQKVYNIRHGALGKFSLFLVPIGRRTRTSPEYYEAVINRRTS